MKRVGQARTFIIEMKTFPLAACFGYDKSSFQGLYGTPLNHHVCLLLPRRRACA